MNDIFYQFAPSYSALDQKLRELKYKYPFIKVFPAGKSVLGRKIPVIGIGNLKHVNLFTAAIHAQEWLTCSLIMRYTEDLCQCIKKGRKIAGVDFKDSYLRRGLLVVPMANPDGVEIALHGASAANHYQKRVEEQMLSSGRSWQANVRGVDLNHNFDAGYLLSRIAEIEAGITGPGPRQYGGSAAHSEPETRALVNLCHSFTVKSAYAFHSQGEEIYYSYGKHTPPASKYMAELFGSYSGYTVTDPTGLASHAGFKDWFIDHFHRPGFTFEIGRGENPLPISDLPEVYHTLRSTLAIASVL